MGNNVVNTLLNSAVADKFSYLHILSLTNAIGTVSGLILNGWIPPPVIVNDVVCRSKSEPRSPSFQ